MDYETIRLAHRTTEHEEYGTPLSQKPMKKDLDKFRGCIIGGAAGDALGYAVEFMPESMIYAQYGKPGITEYQLRDGLARISDDTQMTLFTANGLLYGMTRGHVRGIMGPYASYIANAYQEWYRTQTEHAENSQRPFMTCWLMNIPELFAARAPGNTCMTAIRQGCYGSIEKPINQSKGCGGVMRVAPIGLYFGNPPALTVDLIGADAAALTHGHEMGYIPAALLVHIVRLLAYSDEITPREAVVDGLEAMKRLFPEAEYLPGFIKRIERAMAYVEKDTDDVTAIHALGEGWTGDQAIAIAIYCALKYPNDFDKAIIAAVNHDGDSDSTGAITGNILGAYLGLKGIPEKYTRNLELLDVLTEIADDLYDDCPLDGYNPARTPKEAAWEKKYIFVSYPDQ